MDHIVLLHITFAHLHAVESTNWGFLQQAVAGQPLIAIVWIEGRVFGRGRATERVEANRLSCHGCLFVHLYTFELLEWRMVNGSWFVGAWTGSSPDQQTHASLCTLSAVGHNWGAYLRVWVLHSHSKLSLVLSCPLPSLHSHLFPNLLYDAGTILGCFGRLDKSLRLIA